MIGHHLTAEQQRQAFTEWGGAGSFRCCACGKDVTEPMVHTTEAGGILAVRMAVCRACARRLNVSPTYRRQTRQRATEAAQRAIWQRVADLVGVTGGAMFSAMRWVYESHGRLGPQHMDARLGVPAGSVETALLHVLAPGKCQ